jgi:hypothetical protein
MATLSVWQTDNGPRTASSIPSGREIWPCRRAAGVVKEIRVARPARAATSRAVPVSSIRPAR